MGFASPLVGEDSYSVVITYTIRKGVCSASSDGELVEMFDASWLGDFKAPVTNTRVEASFSPVLAARAKQLCLTAKRVESQPFGNSDSPGIWCRDHLEKTNQTFTYVVAGPIENMHLDWPPLALSSPAACEGPSWLDRFVALAWEFLQLGLWLGLFIAFILFCGA